jgi:hypothetical protein
MAKNKATIPNWSELEAMHAQGPFQVEIPKDVQTKMQVAPTLHPEKPRALTIGYNEADRTLLVIFRDNTWWEYRNVPVEIWLGLKNSTSTGTYLKSSGLDNWGDMGPANIDKLSEGTRAMFSGSAASAARIQKGMLTANEYLFGRE